MSGLPPDAPLARALGRLLASPGGRGKAGEWTRAPLPSSREVYRFTCRVSGSAAVGKFFTAKPPTGPLDLGLAREYRNYLQARTLGLANGRRLIPRLLGRRPEICLGLLLEAIPGPDLDSLLKSACHQGDQTWLHLCLESLAELLAKFHSCPAPETPVSAGEALSYLDKLLRQLGLLGLLDAEDEAALMEERAAWAERLRGFPDRQVLVHGDATPTNFLFPDGRAVALDLERLRLADRLWDLSWVTAELRHGWGWRTGNPAGAEAAIGHFFGAYLATRPKANNSAQAERLFFLNPFYMAMAELRIARNPYLSWDYRRGLIAEARRSLAGGRRL